MSNPYCHAHADMASGKYACRLVACLVNDYGRGKITSISVLLNGFWIHVVSKKRINNAFCQISFGYNKKSLYFCRQIEMAAKR